MGVKCKKKPYNNIPSNSIVLSSSMPNLSTLDTESLNGFLEQCQQQDLDDNRMVLQISEDVRYLIRTKLKSNPTPSYSAAQNFD